MTSRTTRAFRERFEQLPKDVQRQARAAYRLWRLDPHHASLRFRRVHATEPIYSVPIGSSWRALGLRRNQQEIVWFWVGSHSDYVQLLAQR